MVGRARLRGAGPRGRPVRPARRPGHRAPCRCARCSRPTSSTRTSPSSTGACGAACGGPSARPSATGATWRPPARSCREVRAARGRPQGGPRPRRRGRADGAGAGGRHRGDDPRPHHLHRRRRLRAGRGDRGGHLAQSGPRRPLAGAHPVRDRRALRRAACRLPRRRPGDRLRRRHRRPLPLRDHVPRRRPPGEHRGRAAPGPAPAGLPARRHRPGRDHRPVRQRPLGHRRPLGDGVDRPAAATPTSTCWASRCSPPTCSPSRPRPPSWSSPWSGRWCWPAGRRGACWTSPGTTRSPAGTEVGEAADGCRWPEGRETAAWRSTLEPAGGAAEHGEGAR